MVARRIFRTSSEEDNIEKRPLTRGRHLSRVSRGSKSHQSRDEEKSSDHLVCALRLGGRSQASIRFLFVGREKAANVQKTKRYDEDSVVQPEFTT